VDEYGARDREHRALRQRHVADFEAMLPEYAGRIDWPSELIRKERLRALRMLLAVAIRRSPWHRDRLAGIDPGAFSEADIASLPVMTKTDLMENFDTIVTDRRVTRELCERHLDELAGDAYLLGEYHVVASGGSSGQRGVFVYSWDAWAICWA
jgi:phenylacetate-CoA ligase